MTGARRTNIKEPVEVENPEVTEDDKNDNPEVVEDDDTSQIEAEENEGGAVKDDRTPEQAAADKAEFLAQLEADLIAARDDIQDEIGDETEIVPDWYPGQPCLNCGARNYRYAVGWGAACSVCLNPPVDEE